jgi:PKD repeat protein
LDITVKANPIGIVSGGGTYNFGSEVTLTAKPYSGYEFVNWTVNGEEKSQEPVYTFFLTDRDALDYTANFRLTSFAMRPYKQFVGEPVQFDASMLFVNNANITFDWFFGDGGSDLGRDAGPVFHTFNATGTYTVSVIATPAGTEEGVTTTREIEIVEPLPLEQSYFRVDPPGIQRVKPGGQVQWTLEFSNNGVPMMGKPVTVDDGVAGGSTTVFADEFGKAGYETTVPLSGELGSIHNVTFSHETLRSSVSVQVHSAEMTLRGRVSDAQSGLHLKNVVVTANGKEAVTDEDGVYTVIGLDWGETCFLTVNHPGYYYHTSSRLLDSTLAEHNIPLNVKPGDDPSILRIYSEHTDSSKRVDTFLTYGDGLSLTFQAVINWGDQAPGKVDFILPNRTVQGTLNSLGASCQVNMDEEFKPGERLYVQAYSGEGTGYGRRDAFLEVTPPPPFDSNEFKLPPLDDIQAPADLKYIGGMNMGFDWTSLKVEFDRSWDGVFSMYVGYVIDKKDAEPNDLSDPDKLKEATKIQDKLKSQKSVAKTTTDFDLVLGGKFTWTYCQKEADWVLKEGWLAITGSASITKTWYYMTPILIPVYIQVGAGGSMTVKLMLSFEDQLFLEGTMSPALWLRVAAGVGLAGLASLEVFAKIDGKIEVGFAEPDFKTEVGITGGGRIVFFLFSEGYSYRQAWKWPDKAAGSSFMLTLAEPGEVKPLSRAYLKQPSAWLPPGEIRVMAVGDGEMDNFRETTIQTNIFPYSEAQLVPTADGPMLVWLTDNPGRTDVNRTMAQYSLYNGITWTAPQPLKDDGTADFYPQVAGWQGNQDKSAAAAWMKVGEVLGDNAGYKEVLEKSRVAMSFYNRAAGTWADFAEFAPPAGYQYTAPQIGAAGNSALVVWNRSPFQEGSGLLDALHPDQTDFLFSRWNGSAWSTPGQAVTGAGRVIKSSLAYDGDKALLAYVVDEDGSFETVADQELYYTTFTQGNWSAPVRVTENAVQDTNPQALYLEGEPMLFWYQDGKVLYLKNLAGSPQVALEKQSDGLSDFTLAAGENDSLTLVWGDGVSKEPVNSSQVLADGKDRDLGAQEIFASVYDPDFDSWSRPIQLTDTGLFNRSIDAMLDAEGNVLAVFNRATMYMLDREGEDLEIEAERTDLIFAQLQLGVDLAVEEVTLSEENPVPGSRVTAGALVANLGERAWEDVKVAFYEGDPQLGGQPIGQPVILTGVLGGGERRLTDIEWDIPNELEARQLYVVVDPGHEAPDRNLANNKGFVSAAMADLEVAEVTTQLVGFDEFLITARVMNRGLITAESTALSLFGTEAGEFGPVRGDLLEKGELGGLLPGEQKEVTLRWRYRDADFGEDGTTFLVLEAASPTPNVLGGANTARVLMRKPVTQGGAVQEFGLGRNGVTLFEGDQYQMQGIFNPPDATNRGITWQSTNAGVAQVDAGGKVFALAEGTAVITATTQDGGFTDTCTVTVVKSSALVYGDVSGNGQVDVGDAILVLRHIVGLVDIGAEYGPEALIRAKVNTGGGALDVGDAILILRYIVGLITKFPVEG